MRGWWHRQALGDTMLLTAAGSSRSWEWGRCAFQAADRSWEIISKLSGLAMVPRATASVSVGHRAGLVPSSFSAAHAAIQCSLAGTPLRRMVLFSRYRNFPPDDMRWSGLPPVFGLWGNRGTERRDLPQPTEGLSVRLGNCPWEALAPDSAVSLKGFSSGRGLSISPAQQH